SAMTRRHAHCAKQHRLLEQATLGLGHFESRRRGESGMNVKKQGPSASRRLQRLFVLVAAACVLLPRTAAAQELTGALIGTVKDTQGGVLSGAIVQVSSPALIGGPATLTTNEKGQVRFPALPPGAYALDIAVPGFAPLHEE